MEWLLWVVGALLLVGAGFLSARLTGRRIRRAAADAEWSAARSAIAQAAISRDAVSTPLPEADRLLARAELIAAEQGGTAAARSAGEYARRADRLWRAAGG